MHLRKLSQYQVSLLASFSHTTWWLIFKAFPFHYLQTIFFAGGKQLFVFPQLWSLPYGLSYVLRVSFQDHNLFFSHWTIFLTSSLYEKLLKVMCSWKYFGFQTERVVSCQGHRSVAWPGDECYQVGGLISEECLPRTQVPHNRKQMVSQKQKSSSYWCLLGLLFFSIGIALKIHSQSLSDVVVCALFCCCVFWSLEFLFWPVGSASHIGALKWPSPTPEGIKWQCSLLSHLWLELLVVSRFLILFIL